MRTKKGLAGLLSIGLLAGAAIAPATVAAQDDEVRIEVVSHGQASDPFWSVVQNGVNAAATDMGVTANYSAPTGNFDPVAMAQLIDTAVASQPDGLVVSIPDVNALGPSIQAAVEAGIPVISMNSGSDVYKDLGILTHVGQTEYEAGLGGGERMAQAGVTNALCVNQEVGNVALDLRCQGFTDAITAAGGTVETIVVELADPTGAQATIEGALANNPDVNGILTLGPTGAAPALAALEAGGQLDDRAGHVRPLARGPPGDRRWQRALRDRPAAVPPGLPADRHAVAVQPLRRPDAGWWRRGPHRAGLRHRGQRGCGHRAVSPGHPLVADPIGHWERGRCPAPSARPSG
jgi:ABC-type sugar transport system substrate-binding protein